MKHKAKINSLELEGDRKIFDIVKDLDLLSSLQWPQSTIERFITEWEMGNPRLPSVEYPKLRFTDERKKLSDIEGEIKANSPISDYLRKTTQSYRLLLELLENLGTNNVTALSESLYGLPIDSVPASQSNHLKAAEFFLKVCSDHKDSPLSEECILLDAVSVKKLLEEKLSKVFSSGEVKVELNSDLSAKAKTSKNTVFLRKNADFSEYDIDQLLNHEIFIHSLTSINGAAQPLHCLSLDCPRTTEDQEGLATFAEKITGSIDISRLERIALRVVAIDKALSGADFIEIFRFFLESGQSVLESAYSAMRVFRGVPLTGGHAFTKDIVYLKGLTKVHTFFRWALKNHKLNLCRDFMAGRMTVDDVIALEPYFESGVLRAPLYLPIWMKRVDGLAGNLAFSVFANRIRVRELTNEFTFDDELDI